MGTYVAPDGHQYPHVRVRRHDDKDGITWDQLQDVKNELLGPDTTAIEVYPPACDLVNEANMRHLWVLPDHLPLPSLRRP